MQSGWRRCSCPKEGRPAGTVSFPPQSSSFREGADTARCSVGLDWTDGACSHEGNSQMNLEFKDRVWNKGQSWKWAMELRGTD